VAGIGHPERFFTMLRSLGYKVEPHPFPDHHRFRPRDLDFAQGRRLVMTEKDAVKCRPWAGADWWYLEVEAALPGNITDALNRWLQQRPVGRGRPVRRVDTTVR